MEDYTVNDNDSPLSALSEKEAVCVVSYLRGKTRKETARDLGISPETVKTYMRRAEQKTFLNKRGLFEAMLEAGGFGDGRRSACND